MDFWQKHSGYRAKMKSQGGVSYDPPAVRSPREGRSGVSGEVLGRTELDPWSFPEKSPGRYGIRSNLQSDWSGGDPRYPGKRTFSTPRDIRRGGVRTSQRVRARARHRAILAELKRKVDRGTAPAGAGASQRASYRTMVDQASMRRLLRSGRALAMLEGLLTRYPAAAAADMLYRWAWSQVWNEVLRQTGATNRLYDGPVRPGEATFNCSGTPSGNFIGWKGSYSAPAMCTTEAAPTASPPAMPNPTVNYWYLYRIHSNVPLGLGIRMKMWRYPPNTTTGHGGVSRSPRGTAETPGLVDPLPKPTGPAVSPVSVPGPYGRGDNGNPRPPYQKRREPPPSGHRFRRKADSKANIRNQGVASAILRAAESASEAADFIGSLYEALPKSVLRQAYKDWNRNVPNGEERQPPPWYKAIVVIKNSHRLNLAEGLRNYVVNEIEDRMWAKLSGPGKRLNQMTGRMTGGERALNHAWGNDNPIGAAMEWGAGKLEQGLGLEDGSILGEWTY